MLTRQIFAAMAVAGFFLFAGSLVEANSQTLLGTRNVTDRVDHDTIRVTASRGDFRRIQFRVSRRPIELYRVVVHYGNGADDRLEVRENVRAGGSTRWIDLRGGDRVIRSIEFWYDAGSIGRGGTATIRVYGMH